MAWHTAASTRAAAASSRPATLSLHCAGEHRAQALAALAAVGRVPASYVVLAPLAVGTCRGQSKCWPGFAELAQGLHELGVATVCCPGPGEEELMRAQLPTALILPGLGLGAYAAVCRAAQLTIANDSGPMHLAAAAGGVVLGVFGPSDPQRTHPWSPQAHWLGGCGEWPSGVRVLKQVCRLLGR